jgi:hypothetical protein
MARRYEHESRWSNRTVPLARLVDAVERGDQEEIDHLRSALAREEEGSLLRLEHEAEKVARRRISAATLLDRLRNLFQAILLLRRLP